MGGLPAPVIREQIHDTRTRTSKPFGVGLLLPVLQGGEVEACVEERVPVLLLFWGDMAPHVALAKRAGVRVFAQVGSVAEAKAAAAAGVDAIVAQGFEAGGHVRGTTSVAALVPAVVHAVDPLPVIAAPPIASCATGRSTSGSRPGGLHRASARAKVRSSAACRSAAR
jgi:nitronate monooxygenase